MAFGNLTIIAQSASQGPIYFDRITLVGDSGYGAGGTAGLKAKLQTATKDGRVPFAVVSENNAQVPQYDVATEKLIVYEQDAGGSLAEVSGSQAGFTYKLCVISK